MAFEFDLNSVKWIKGSYGLPEAVHKIKVPSVSTILGEMIPDPEYDAWVLAVGKQKADEIMKKAGNRGSSMHMFIENFVRVHSKTRDVSEALRVTQEDSPKMLKEDLIPEDKIEEGRNLFYKFYYSSYSTQFADMLAIEMGIYSATLFYRGKLDILYRDKLFGISLTDFKSSNGKIKKGSTKELKHFYQLGAYSRCIREMYKEKNISCNRASILCIDKQTDILQEIILDGKQLIEYEDKFVELIKLYHVKNGQEYLIV
jgi:hypothetical protein